MKSKKNIVKVLGIIVILLVISIVLLIINKPQKVEKFSTAKIVDTYENEIKNYAENKMPFMIKTDSKNEKITVNGKNYQQGERIYQKGEYKIVVTNGFNKEESIVNIKEIEKKEQNEYNIYITTETLPTLFANLDMANNNEAKGFMWTALTSMVNIESVKNRISNIQISEYVGKLEEEEFRKKVLPELNEYIKKILQEDENAYFNLYTEEDRFYLDLELFGKIGLNDNRYNITMYTNGTLGYVREYEITKVDKYERFLEEKEDYTEIVNTIKNNTKEHNNHPGSYLVDPKSIQFDGKYNYDYMLISTLRNNIKYELQYPEMIEYKDENIKKQMEESNIVKVTAQEKYDKLEQEEKEIFFNNINFKKEEFDKKYFEKQDEKYLIITGTVPFYKDKTKEEFENMIKKVSSDFKDEYTILYKPHPRAIPDEEQEKFLSSLGIKVLPGAMPMEAILFIYPNLKIGGFGSSLYMSADKGKTLFFFANQKEELVEPLNKLYDKIFNDAKFYN